MVDQPAGRPRLAQSNCRICLANMCCGKHSESARGPFSWLCSQAQGQLFQGECLQIAMVHAQQHERSDINFWDYMGMFKPDCVCSWCQDRAGKWKSEMYRVKDEWVSWIVQQMNIIPEVDAFATNENNCWPVWWGPGSSTVEDSFSINWSGRLLWCNPPYSRWAQTVDKIKSDGAHALLVMPRWSNREWYKKAKSMAVRQAYIPPGEQVFQLGDQNCEGTRWPIDILLVCGHDVQCKFPRQFQVCVRRPLVERAHQPQEGCARGPIGDETLGETLDDARCAGKSRSSKRKWRKQKLEEFRNEENDMSGGDNSRGLQEVALTAKS